MRKHFYLWLILVFSFLVLSVVKPSFGATTIVTAPLKLTVTPKPSDMLKKEPDLIMTKSKYALPYPGILPDHPLYFLKSLRDSILDKLIADPVRKAEFNLLQADKKLQMGLGLFNKGKESMGADYLSNAEKHMEMSIVGLVSFKANSKEVPGYIVERLAEALGKHTEVLEEFLNQAKPEQKSSVSTALELTQKLQGELGKLK